jgi:hypothetical protein
VIGCASNSGKYNNRPVSKNGIVSDEYILNAWKESELAFDPDGRPFGIKLLGLPEKRLADLLSLKVTSERIETPEGIQIWRYAEEAGNMIFFSAGVCTSLYWSLSNVNNRIVDRIVDRIVTYDEKYTVRERGNNFIYYYCGEGKMPDIYRRTVDKSAGTRASFFYFGEVEVDPGLWICLNGLSTFDIILGNRRILPVKY